LVRIQPDPPYGFARDRGGLAQLGEHLLCKQGVVGSIPTSSTSTSKRLVGRVVHSVCKPKRLSSNGRATLVCHASGCCSLKIYRNRIEIVDGKSAGVKAFGHRAVNDIMIASTDIFIFEVCEYDDFDRRTRNTQILTIQSVISVLDDVTLVG
jgi:hypothetical protein